MGVKIARAVIVRLIGHRLDRRPGLAEPRCDLRDRADLHIDERRTERRKVGGGVGASDEAVSARDPRMRQVEPRIGHRDRKSVVSGKRVSVRVDLGGRRIIKQTTRKLRTQEKRQYNQIYVHLYTDNR